MRKSASWGCTLPSTKSLRPAVWPIPDQAGLDSKRCQRCGLARPRAHGYSEQVPEEWVPPLAAISRQLAVGERVSGSELAGEASTAARFDVSLHQRLE